MKIFNVKNLSHFIIVTFFIYSGFAILNYREDINSHIKMCHSNVRYYPNKSNSDSEVSCEGASNVTRIAEGVSLSFATSARFLVFLSHTIVKVTKNAEEKNHVLSQYVSKKISMQRKNVSFALR